MSDDPVVCGKCGEPIGPSASGLRYFGSYVFHSERGCLDALRQRVASAEATLATARAEAMEEAAKVAEEFIVEDPAMVRSGERLNELVGDIAAAIRALGQTP